MAVRKKIFIPNQIHFITFTILGWKNIFINDEYRGLVYKWFDYMKKECGNKINGYVIMPNHIHCLLYVTDKSPRMPALIQNAKRFLAYQIVKYLKEDNKTELLQFFRKNAKIKKGAKHKIFEDNYDSLVIQSLKLFLEKLNYIHKNPCAKKRRLAKAPEEYKYSSVANYMIGKGFYDIDLIEF